MIVFLSNLHSNSLKWTQIIALSSAHWQYTEAQLPPNRISSAKLLIWKLLSRASQLTRVREGRCAIGADFEVTPTRRNRPADERNGCCFSEWTQIWHGNWLRWGDVGTDVA